MKILSYMAGMFLWTICAGVLLYFVAMCTSLILQTNFSKKISHDRKLALVTASIVSTTLVFFLASLDDYVHFRNNEFAGFLLTYFVPQAIVVFVFFRKYHDGHIFGCELMKLAILGLAGYFLVIFTSREILALL